MKRAVVMVLAAILLTQLALPAQAGGEGEFPQEYEMLWQAGDNFVNCGWDILYDTADEQNQSFVRDRAKEGAAFMQQHWSTAQNSVRPVADPAARAVRDVDNSTGPTYNMVWGAVVDAKCLVLHGIVSPLLYQYVWSNFVVKCTFISTLTCGINLVNCNAFLPFDVLLAILSGEAPDPRLYAPTGAPATPATRPWTECEGQWTPEERMVLP